MSEVFFLIPRPPLISGLTGNSKKGGRTKTDKYRSWIREAGMMLNVQKAANPQEKWMIRGRVRVVYAVSHPGDKRKRDLKNYEKALDDFLTLHRVIVDDSLIESSYIQWERDGNIVADGNVRVIVTSVEDL